LLPALLPIDRTATSSDLQGVGRAAERSGDAREQGGAGVLRRVEDVQVFYKRDVSGLLTGKYEILLQVGRKEHLSTRRLPVAEFRALEALSAERPVAYLTVGERTFWRYDGRWHSDNEGLNEEAVTPCSSPARCARPIRSSAP
jgi:hypothetical protein